MPQVRTFRSHYFIGANRLIEFNTLWLTADTQLLHQLRMYANLTKGTWPESLAQRIWCSSGQFMLHYLKGEGRRKYVKEPFRVKLCTHHVMIMSG